MSAQTFRHNGAVCSARIRLQRPSKIQPSRVLPVCPQQETLTQLEFCDLLNTTVTTLTFSPVTGCRCLVTGTRNNKLHKVPFSSRFFCLHFLFIRANLACCDEEENPQSRETSEDTKRGETERQKPPCRAPPWP